MNIKKELGEKIKRYRKKRGLTQEQLAEMVEISARNLSNIEIGISFAKAETLEKILEALDVTTEEIFSNNSIKNSTELRQEIDSCLDKIQRDNLTLEKIYKIVKCLTDEV